MDGRCVGDATSSCSCKIQQREEEEEGSSTPVATTPPPSSVGKRPRRTAKPLLPAALRGRYELHSLRGQGTFAEVWEARHLRTGHQVAIKIILAAPQSQISFEVFVMRLLSLRQPQHPHIVRFYEYEAVRSRSGDHTTTYIVMELAEQGQLHDLVAVRERLPEAQARTLFQQLVAGVAYCHRSMVVHRDLKMENVLLDSRGHVKIADFGFSRLWAPGRLQAESCGSPQYAAPELLDGRLYEGPEVDVWSCGVILYAMLCGRLPFDAGTDDISDLRRNIRRGDFRRLPSWVSDDARDLISSMLIVRPQKRATITEVRAHRWLQQDMPRYLQAMLPPPPTTATTSIIISPDAQEYQQPRAVDDDDAATGVELLPVTRHGFDDERGGRVPPAGRPHRAAATARHAAAAATVGAGRRLGRRRAISSDPILHARDDDAPRRWGSWAYYAISSSASTTATAA
ncbi:hypothetical protein PVAP13_4KG013605 [Panicum virgatum]|uniref:Protein kinase domain-containing protein n=1 Tax=Panicum virgatum TaxID=38727 RepID=A0A8T0TGP2_PANVG|nr:hypothetical protein PVAP13_4KG013605 [Panicum virgatum]